MVKKITNYSVLILICISLSLLLLQGPISKLFSYFNVHVLDSVAYAQTTYRTFTVTAVTGTGVNSTNPGAATDDAGYVYVTYEEGTSYVDFKLSTNNGTSFGSAVHVGTGLGRYPRVAIDNVQEAYAIYTYYDDSEAGKGPYWPRGFKSIHPGSIYTFSKILEGPNIAGKDLVTSEGASTPIYCDIAVENVGGSDNVFAVWSDDMHVAGDFTIYFIGSNNSGTTWTLADKAISTNADARYPTIAVKKSEEDDAYVAWVHIGNHIMFDYTENGGTTWQGKDVAGANFQISDDADVVENQRPGLAASVKSATTYLAALWCDNRNGNKDVYYDYAVDGGATWHTDVKIGNSSYAAYDQDQPSIAVAPGGNHLYAVWRDSRDGTNHIYFQEATYIDAATGFRWGIDDNADGTVSASEAGDDLRVSSSASGSEETPTVLASAIGKVYVIWRDTGSGIKCARYGSGTTPTPTPSPIAGTPAAPTGLVAVGYNSRVGLDWSDNSESDLSYYKVYRGTSRGTYSSIASSVSSSLYEDTSAVNSTAYWYVVTAVDTEAKESGYSNDARATPNAADVTAPNAPTGLAVTAGNTQIALAWTASTSTDVSSYHIYRSNVSASSYYYVSSTSSPVASYLNSSLANGTKYYYVVTALDGSNNESADSNEANATTTGSYTPGGGTAPDPAPDGGGGGPGGGCFIATASYGSPFAEEVRVLSRFRDTHLTTNIFGRAFVRAYYNLSPPAAKFISGNPVLKFMVRLYLKPLVKLAGLVVG